MPQAERSNGIFNYIPLAKDGAKKPPLLITKMRARVLIFNVSRVLPKSRKPF